MALEPHALGRAGGGDRRIARSPLSAIGHLPFDADCRIVEATPMMRGSVQVRLQPKVQLVNMDAGRIWNRLEAPE